MKKYLWIFLIIAVAGVGIGFYIFNNNQENGYTATRTGTNNNENKGSISNLITGIEENETEEKISEFTTRLPNDTEARDDNIKLACKTLSGTVVKSGEEFSLWDVIGCPTKERGYEKAKSFT